MLKQELRSLQGSLHEASTAAASAVENVEDVEEEEEDDEDDEPPEGWLKSEACESPSFLRIASFQFKKA